MSFRRDVRDWLDGNCPQSCRGPGLVPGGGTKVPMTDDQRLWIDRCAERGFTVPTWPEEYGGAGLDKDEFVALLQEMRELDIRAPVSGMGTTMIGPTLLEYGTDDQKARHLPRIARGEVWWCQGYSEPSSGSDLASLRTRAEDAGDHFVINGQKIWTSGANNADWIFCLVRTDPDVPKHEGISFLLFTMNQPGVTVRPIRLISGASPFCETFFDNAIAQKEDLVGELNKGWTVAKRLLQHERSGIGMLASGTNRESGAELYDLARGFAGEDDGRIADEDLRRSVASHYIDAEAFRLTQRRTVEESQGSTPGPQTSIFKYYGANLRKERAELQVSMMGTRGIGWEGDGFGGGELGMTRAWLAGKAGSIAGGSNEVQLNIIAKRVLGLPD
ncbi:MAG: acyl-CoA dehydrogenase [Gammaproteobacteria bacterium]|nr:acyl-CoA dehydrogenase [Gammaproteobacteria bacterium]MYF31102.1 acyl-CoA dehydrogenase [Gammaproteobacteria bacterium]MYK45379.1 acyl-CoA dehydrogenase [Gammaproteobacteria bacterium]